ncbi:alpha/beta hydrolase family protein [Thermodesulfovibrio sp. TK110]
MNYFISGWAGFREALDVPEEWHFIVPFIDLDEQGILDFFKDKSGKTLIGWSTGGHIILKNFQFFSLRFNEIIVVAGFKKFTDYVNPRILRRMIDKMEIQPEAVIKEFLLNAGCKPILPVKVDKNALKEGLKFLVFSEFNYMNYPKIKLIFIHGSGDKILPITALFDLKKIFPFAQTHIISGSHWIPFRILTYIPR